MSSNPPKQGEPLAAEAAAVRHLAEHGFEATTASELADAMGMSRSTFFRRFGSKEDVIFADHALALEQLERALADTSLAPSLAVVQATLEVMHVLVRDADTARLRWELLRRNPALRERELVITHRYERLFAEHLARAAAPGTPSWAPIALAAGLVAVHNAALRRWLRHSDTRALDAVERELGELTDRFSPWFGGDGEVRSSRSLDSAHDSSRVLDGAHRSSRVLVAAFEASADPEEVLRSLAARLG